MNTMSEANFLFQNLKTELEQLRQHHPALKEEDLFLVWFLRAYVTDDPEIAVKSITNGPKDKGVDALWIDDNSRTVFIVQGKYRHNSSSKAESRQDVMGFAHLAHLLRKSEKKAFKNYLNGADSIVSDRIMAARNKLERYNYRLWLYYVTMGKCSIGLSKEAQESGRLASGTACLEILDQKRLKLIMRDYLVGLAPPIPILDLVMEKGQGIAVNGILQRYDAKSKIESWVFSMQGRAVADLYKSAGMRLFARNIRGFLGEDTEINKSMGMTLRNEPERFFYYNNGITVICDGAERVGSQGKDILRVNNPQVINGQQTTRTLSNISSQAGKASVLVRVIQIPRGMSDNDVDFDLLISQIVQGTNWQNAIRSSDLIANDRTQVELQRELRKLGYLYLRKRESKGEAKRIVGCKQYKLLKKEDLARAVAGCDLDPVEARSGVENLFDEESYPSVFATSDPRYYLTRYWLMRDVTYCAKGYPERGYAKWLVLGFTWARLAPILHSKSAQDRFINGIERGRKELEWPLIRAIDKVFIAAANYWRKNRGKGAKAIDVSTFYRNKRGRDKEFESFWRGKNNKSRGTFERNWKAVISALSE
jgi:hypothetical protein